VGNFCILLKVAGGGEVKVAIDSTTTANDVIVQVRSVIVTAMFLLHLFVP
jgi:hypothetical protein